jgi:hypothetical protein
MNHHFEEIKTHAVIIKNLMDSRRFYKEQINRLYLKRQKSISGAGLKSLSLEKAINNLEKLGERLNNQLKIAEDGDFETYDKLADWVETNERQLKALKKSQRKRVNVYEFSYELIDIIKERVTIVDMVDELKFKKKRSGGGRYVINCPFHDEDTPSCMIYVHDDKYHCFGCSASGDVIDFYQNILEIEFDEAISRLCDKLSIQVMDADQVEEADKIIKLYKDVLEDVEEKIREENIKFARSRKL